MKNSADEWYQQYIHFIAAVKNRVTHWKEKEKYRPSLPNIILEKLKEIRILLRVLTRESKTIIRKHKAARWNEFLSNSQTAFFNYHISVCKHFEV